MGSIKMRDLILLEQLVQALEFYDMFDNEKSDPVKKEEGEKGVEASNHGFGSEEEFGEDFGSEEEFSYHGSSEDEDADKQDDETDGAFCASLKKQVAPHVEELIEDAKEELTEAIEDIKEKATEIVKDHGADIAKQAMADQKEASTKETAESAEKDQGE